MDSSRSKDVLAPLGIKTPRARMPTAGSSRAKRIALVADKPLRFDVGGTIFKVAAATVFSLPEGVLAKIASQPRGIKEESGAFFVDRDPELFRIVLDALRDKTVYPLPPGITDERVRAELRYFGLEDVLPPDAPTTPSSASIIVRALTDHWELQTLQQKQFLAGKRSVIFGLAQMMFSKAAFKVGDTILECPPLDPKKLVQDLQLNSGEERYNLVLAEQDPIHKALTSLLARFNIQATVTSGTRCVNGVWTSSGISLKPIRTGDSASMFHRDRHAPPRAL